MIAEIVSVGTELLLGQTVDTDAVFLAQMLSRLGVNIYYRVTVGDNSERLREILTRALARADLVITVGGLGPTEDDLTKEIAAEVLNVDLTEDAQHAQWLREFVRSRGSEPPASFAKQALIPAQGRGIPNPNGTALGALFETNGKIVICLPGPPNELVPMAEGTVEPYIREKTQGQRQIIRSQTLRIVGMGESLVEERVRDLMQGANPTIAPYAKTGEVHLRITARAGNEDESDTLIKPLELAIRQRLGNVIYGVNEETLEYTIVQRLLNLGKTLATAESCTGGWVAQRITSVPDASQVFSEGFVTYSNEAKRKYLGVAEETLILYGAVSPETAQEMAAGTRNASKADLAVSVTGIAGPGGGTSNKPVGTVHIGLAWDKGVTSEKFLFLGSRTDVRIRAAQAALDLVRRYLLDPDAIH